MRHLKMLGLTALAAALMVFAAVGTALAATLDDGSGAMGVGDTISAESSHTVLHPPIGLITCAKSTVSGKITEAHGVTGEVTSLSFSSCDATVIVENKGALSINGSGVVTGSGQAVTVHFSNGFKCTFSTSNTKLGTLTSSSKTGSHAVFDIEATIPRTGGSSFCGSTAQWTGQYTVTSPSILGVFK